MTACQQWLFGIQAGTKALEQVGGLLTFFDDFTGTSLIDDSIPTGPVTPGSGPRWATISGAVTSSKDGGIATISSPEAVPESIQYTLRNVTFNSVMIAVKDVVGTDGALNISLDGEGGSFLFFTPTYSASTGMELQISTPEFGFQSFTDNTDYGGASEIAILISRDQTALFIDGVELARWVTVITDYPTTFDTLTIATGGAPPTDASAVMDWLRVNGGTSTLLEDFITEMGLVSGGLEGTEQFIESFSDGNLDLYTKSGAAVYGLAASEWGTGKLTWASQTGAFTNIKRALPSDLTISRMTGKFRCTSFGLDDACSVNLVNNNVLLFAFQPRREGFYDAYRRPAMLTSGGALYPSGTTAGDVITLNTWYRFDIKWSSVIGQSWVRIYNPYTGALVSEASALTMGAYTQVPFVVDEIRFLDDTAIGGSATEYDDIRLY